ncbi:hypothetical protein MP638_004107 [Amoeboaphelidium occidentale]|nr:hypothetical protein MP638_004107 [Amoeboaphelidium occidentale]
MKFSTASILITLASGAFAQNLTVPEVGNLPIPSDAVKEIQDIARNNGINIDGAAINSLLPVATQLAPAIASNLPNGDIPRPTEIKSAPEVSGAEKQVPIFSFLAGVSAFCAALL